MPIKSSQTAVNMIVMYEVSSESTYTQKYQKPTWPGGMSGVTIGIGYDLGYSTPDAIKADWGDQLPASMVQELIHVSGIHGSPASSATHALLGKVEVPWTAAMNVFEKRDMPKWEGVVTRALPNTNCLNGDSFGALVSLTYNRGASYDLNGDRYREMRSIKAHMTTKDFDAIPDDIRSMCRLWPTVTGLIVRRKGEANLFEKGVSDTESALTA